MNASDFLNALLPLVIVFGLLYAVLFFVKKYSFAGKSKVSRSMNVKLISSQMIMPKKYISVVQVQDKLLVLGVSEHSITLLKELDFDKSLENEISGDDSKNNFLSVLKNNLNIK